MGVKVKASQGLKKLDEVPNKFRNMKEVYRQIAELELAQTKLRFIKQVEPGDENQSEGKKWPDPIAIRRVGGAARSGGFSPEQSWNYVLKSNYQAVPPGWRWFQSGNDKVLRNSGVLFNSLDSRYTNTYAAVGTDIEYAEKLQEGDGNQGFRFLGINFKTKQNVEYVMKKFFGGLVK